MASNDVPGWDSLAHVRILLNLDSRLATTIDIKKTYSAATIADLYLIVKDAQGMTKDRPTPIR
jgi:acyl carrier protein